MLVLYDKNSQEFETLGLGVLRDLKSDPIITEVLNGLYNLEFDYIKEGWLSEYLIEGNIIKADGQLFRIRNVDKDIKDTKITILAKHIWFDNELNNWLEDVAPTDKVGHTALKWVLDHAKESNKFNITGDCTKTESARYVRMNPIEAIYTADNAILNRFGGEIEIDNFNITLHRRRGNNTGIEIRQKKNLTGAKYSVDLSTLATRIMPIGNDGLLLPEKYVDSPLINNYYAPFYYKLDVDVGVDENAGITLNDCYTKMRQSVQKLFDLGIDKPSVTVSIDFVELSKTKEYEQYSILETAHLGDSCKVFIPGLNVNLTTRIVKIVKNLNNNRIINIELGAPKVNYVTNNNKSTNDMQNVIAKVNPTGILEKARENATSLINHPFGGYIFISENTGELYIMDTNNPSTAQNVWKFGLGGIGFSSTGISGPYNIAITQDGKIVADFIAAGHIDTNLIEGYKNLVLSTGVISAINLSEENIKILSKRLALEGYTTINDGFSVDLQGKVTMNNAVINGGNITLLDTGDNSDPTIEIYNKNTVQDGTIKVGDLLSGKNLKFTWPSKGSTTDPITNNESGGLYNIIQSDGGYTIFGGRLYSAGVYDEIYRLYKDNEIVDVLYWANKYEDIDENYEVQKSLSTYTLPNDFGNVTSINSAKNVYNYILVPNVKNKITTFKSSGINIKDKTNNIYTNYSSNGMSVSDNYGSKYFNEHGILYQTNYGTDYSEFEANKEILYYQSGYSSILMDCMNSSDSDDSLEVKINNDTKMRVDNNGVHYSAISVISLEEYKKNIEKLIDGLEIIKNSEIYQYHLKSQNLNEKKHIGVVIGENYKYPKEVTTENNDGIDIYSMCAIAWKAIQQQQIQIEKLNEEIKELKVAYGK